WLAARMQRQLGDEFWPWVESVAGPAPLDLRVNVAKASRDEALARLRAAGIAAEPTPYSPVGLRVAGKPALQKLDVFSDGWIEVQDEGSQLLALLTGARRGEMVVDFCAGAGGKTLALGAQMRNTGRLYAFDTSGHRLAALKPRLARSGLSNVYPVQIAHERDDRIKRLAGKIDRVLVDAPCTGLGTLRRSPDLKWRQSEASLVELGALQRRILDAAAGLLKPGGRLVYATCSPLVEEDEQVAAEFDAAHAATFARLPVLGLLERAQVSGAEALVSGSDLRLWSHRHGSDGFFAAAWERRRA
ncbi:MAG: RsmB/NOP family class I SAM-dependent RNA methyltransferase, partial [Caldimonas sp.]